MPSSLRRLLPVLILTILAAAEAACGGPSLEGTYTNANANAPATLDIKAGDQASFTVLGDTQPCTYKRDGAQLTLACPGGQSFAFAIATDGSLTSEAFGALKKAAK